MATKPRTVVVTCAVLESEVEHFSQGLDHIVRIETLRQGLHEEPCHLRRDLQKTIDRAERETDAEAIALGYGLCSRGTEGLRATRARIVIPRAHDCITILLGSRERYRDYVSKAPGTFWYSPGWNRHSLQPGEERYRKIRQEYVDRYGHDNAAFLMETEQNWFSTYDRATYVDLGPGATEEDLEFTKECARWLGWHFDRQRGDPALLTALLNCEWDDDRFLVLDPGQTLRLTADERIVEAVPIDAG